MAEMRMYSLRLTEHQAAQLDRLTQLYGSQATAFRVALALLYVLSESADDLPDSITQPLKKVREERDAG